MLRSLATSPTSSPRQKIAITFRSLSNFLYRHHSNNYQCALHGWRSHNGPGTISIVKHVWAFRLAIDVHEGTNDIKKTLRVAKSKALAIWIGLTLGIAVGIVGIGESRIDMICRRGKIESCNVTDLPRTCTPCGANLVADFHGAFLVVECVVVIDVHWVDKLDEGKIVEVAFCVGRATGGEAEALRIGIAGFKAIVEGRWFLGAQVGICWWFVEADDATGFGVAFLDRDCAAPTQRCCRGKERKSAYEHFNFDRVRSSIATARIDKSLFNSGGKSCFMIERVERYQNLK